MRSRIRHCEMYSAIGHWQHHVGTRVTNETPVLIEQALNRTGFGTKKGMSAKIHSCRIILRSKKPHQSTYNVQSTRK